jgi:hypothetical protein
MFVAVGLLLVTCGSGLAITLMRTGSTKPTTLASQSPSTPSLAGQAADEILLASAEPQERMLVGNIRKEFFGIPLKGKTVAYVIDGDATMAPFIDEVAYITNSVNESMKPGLQNFGIVMAINNGGKMMIEVAEPSSNMEGAKSVLLARVPGGETRLQSALAATTNWYADQLFLVVSKPMEPEQIEVLAQVAAQTGAVTSVVALGEAAQQDFSSIAKQTGGEFVAVSDANLEKLVQRHSAKNQN